MKKNGRVASFYRCLWVLLTLFQLFNYSNAQTVSVGNGSYTTQYPGVDQAGRNGYPSGAPQLSGDALGKPVPTNDWWSTVIKEDHAGNLFSYPLGMRTVNEGLLVSYISWGVFDDLEPIIVGVSDLDASQATVSDHSDWTVTMNWTNSTHSFDATAGIGMPFVYFNKAISDVARITINHGTVTVSDEMILIENAHHGASFVVYAPAGSTWTQDGNQYTSALNGKNYWSIAMAPQSTTNLSVLANEYKKYAYVFPSNTEVSWNYDEDTSVLRTDFTVTTDVKEGTETNMLLGLLPHQWANLASDSPTPQEDSFSSVRGELKMLNGNSFSTENTFYGILPTLPYLGNYSESFDLSLLNTKVKALENEGLATWTDSYNEGQVMNRLIQTARIADLTGNIESRDKMLATIKERLEDWLTYENGEVAFLFYYNNTWSAMLGYPAGHGQDNNINDHHFHWGYFIHAAAFLEQYQPGWASQWGDMINHLVYDASSPSRTHEKYPFLRNFSPYAGHCWANGFASFPQGNDQESTSESMQFHSSLIHWGSVTGNDEIRDLGIYLYTTEQKAVEEYWFDMNERTFKPDQPFSLVSRVWGNSYDNGTFWTADIAASYNIELYPIHGGSLYLGHNTDYVQKLWTEMTQNTGILQNEENANLWHDVMWKYLAFVDPQAAIDLYDSYPDRTMKFGVSDAQTYYWLHAMNALGTVETSITANHPLAVAFNNAGDVTYVAQNYSSEPITVAYSNGYTLDVPAGELVTSKDIAIQPSLTSSFSKAYVNGSVDLEVEVTGGTPSKVEFFKGGTLIGQTTSSPYAFKAENLSLGEHVFYAKVYDGENFAISNMVTVTVGDQQPYLGAPSAIPGTIEAGYYDKFEGGLGQGIAYNDVSPNNEGDMRMDEYVDVLAVNNEGATVGWISSGEWLEYTVDVAESGVYEMSFRYASGNGNGGGPFYLELDGKKVSGDISVNMTDAANGWSTFATKTVGGITLTKGEHVLRLSFNNGELNLGRMTFSRTGDLSYNQPVANAGSNTAVILPASSTILDGSNSESPGGLTLIYQWTQVYGPSVATFDDATIVELQVSNLVEGIYAFSLEVSNGSYSDSDEVLVIVGDDANIAPTVSIVSPENNDRFMAGTSVTITAAASDLDGSVTQVDFYEGTNLIGTSTTSPYSVQWQDDEGTYTITAVAIDNAGKAVTSEAITVILTEAFTIDGTWKLAPQAAALAVGPSQGSSGWWANTEGDVTTRACLFDDKYVFESNGTFRNVMDGDTWLEGWQNGGTEGCGSPVAPHDGSNAATWSYDGSSLTLSGVGAHIALPKVMNGAEISDPANAPSNIIYMVTELTATHMTLDIEIQAGGFWRFVLEKESGSTPVLENKEKLVEFYPNPVTDYLHITLPTSDCRIRVFDIRGKLVDDLDCNSTFIKYNMSSLSQGIYVIEVIADNSRQNFKIVKK